MRSNAEVVLAVFRAIEERDREALFELYHDDVELYDAPSLPYGYEGVSGKEAVREQPDTAPRDILVGDLGPAAADGGGSGAWTRGSSLQMATRSSSSTSPARWRPTASGSSRRSSPSMRCVTGSSPAPRCSITTPPRFWLSWSGPVAEGPRGGLGSPPAGLY